jgi:hypothetical protein
MQNKKNDEVRFVREEKLQWTTAAVEPQALAGSRIDRGCSLALDQSNKIGKLE